jgi:diguanylate cyclase (GGDEF)-like protein/putative nucleotidyltransferase with HDIG domain
LLSGLTTVKLPSVAATISVSETFVFTSVLLFGPAAGTLTVTLDVLAISLWQARRRHPNYRIAFNVFALPAALWAGAQLFYLLSGLEPLALSPESVPISALLLPLTAFSVVYFGLNSWLIAFAIWFETGESPLNTWRNNFALLSLNYFGGASVAALLVTYTRNLDFAYVAFVLPLLAVLYFTFSTAMGRAEDANKHLKQLNSLYMSTIETLAMAIDAKDQITHGHIRRVQTYAVGLAKHLGVSDKEQISAIEAASLLHDMGKLAVPEYILNKPGPLTPAEFEKMKKHAAVGADILSAISFPYPVVPIVRHHHENWNGSGYPDGLSGSDIPIGARILSVVDCFDALTSDRPYRPRLTDKEAIKILLERRGTMYDPLVVDTFLRVHHQIAPAELSSESTLSLRAITTSAAGQADLAPGEPRLDEISASTEEMLTLFDLAKGLSPNMTVSDVGDIISKHLRRLIPSSLCVFYLLDTRTDELVAAHVAGAHASTVSGLRIPRGQRLTGWVAANRQTIRNSDPVLDFGESARAMSPRPRSCLSTPLLLDSEIVGVLTLYSSNRDGFTSEHERVLEIIGKQVAPALKQSSELELRRIDTLRDQLTGLPNGQQFERFLESADRAPTAVTPVCLIMIKLERQPRSGGDDLLDLEHASSHVAECLKRILRSTDVVFRYDQNCFVALLLNTTSESSAGLTVRLATEIEQVRSIPGLDIEARMAVAHSPDDGRRLREVFQTAAVRLGSNDNPGHQTDSTRTIH